MWTAVVTQLEVGALSPDVILQICLVPLASWLIYFSCGSGLGSNPSTGVESWSGCMFVVVVVYYTACASNYSKAWSVYSIV